MPNEIIAPISGGPLANNVTYTYDSLDRLTGAATTSYSYDPVANRLTKNATSYTYDKADRILTAGSVSYTVNANGNLTNRDSDVFAYDQANRLTSATVSGTPPWVATADVSGRWALDTRENTISAKDIAHAERNRRLGQLPGNEAPARVKKPRLR